MRGVHQDPLGMVAAAHLPGVRGDDVLRQLAPSARQQACPRERPSRRHVGRAGRALAVLLSGRRVCRILTARSDAVPRYAAFLRGVMPTNAKMPDLKRAFEAAGFTDVRTVLASGNVVFSARS